MKATVFLLSDVLAVAHLQDDKKSYVAECARKGSEWRVLPQSLREVRAIVKEDVEVSDDPTDQDLVDRTTLGIARFRERLKDFDREAAQRASISELVRETEAAKRDLDELLAGVWAFA